jgi:hypothetical protein
MKSLYLPLTALLLVSPAGAEIKMPAGVFRVAKLEEAVKQAKEQHKPLAVVASEEGSRALNDTTEDTLKALTDFAVVVYADAANGSSVEIDQLAPPFTTEFASQLSLPKVVIGSPAEDEVWDTVVSRELGGGKARKAIRQSAAKVKAKSTPYFASKTPVPPVMPGDKLLVWGKLDGKGHYQGKYVRVAGDRVYLSANDTEGSVPFDELLPAAVRYVKFLSEGGGENKEDEDKTAEVKPPEGTKPGAAKPAAEKPAPAPVELWTNKDGKELQAAFVRLADEKVTLRNAEGKEYTIPLESLSLNSRIKAKERAAPPPKKSGL